MPAFVGLAATASYSSSSPEDPRHEYGYSMGPVGPPGDSLARRRAVAGLLRAVRAACHDYSQGCYSRDGGALQPAVARCMSRDVSWAPAAAAWERELQALMSQARSRRQ